MSTWVSALVLPQCVVCFLYEPTHTQLEIDVSHARTVAWMPSPIVRPPTATRTLLACFSLAERTALTFRIGPDFDSAREFVYKLGPQRLDELLSAKVVSDPSPPPSV